MRTIITKTEISCDACGANLTAGGGDAPLTFRVGKIDLCGSCASQVSAQRENDRAHGMMFESMNESASHPDKDSWGK